ncbi:MAG: acetylornithine deacetylase [Bacteroidota bacterium]|jgi:acetylornithine deacetylase
MSGTTATAKQLLANLVSFDTTSSKTNLPCARFVQEYLAGHGIEAYLLPADDGIHANLFATIGPKGDGGVGLSGHMDVVPVTSQKWDTDPFKLTEKDGKLYGRGTCDMKGYLACVLAMVPEFKSRKLREPIHIVFSYDEEVGCTGVKPMIAEMGRTIPKPRLILVGEPTMMTVVDAHKGGYRFITEVTGKDAHSSTPQRGVGAIAIAGELIAELGRIEQRLKATHTNPRFDPPYNSIAVTLIEGGIAQNIVPPKCTFYWGVRALPRFDPLDIMRELDAYAARELLPKMRAVSPDCDIVIKNLGILPAFSNEDNAEATSLALKLMSQNETFAVPYGTEATHFQAAGCSSVICGPGDIAQAHQPNEFLAVSEIDNCLAYLGRLADWAEAA